MVKKYRTWIIISSIIIVLPVVFGIIKWNMLPELMATNFGTSGEANGWSSKPFAVIGLPLFLLAIHLFCILATMYDTKRNNINPKLFLFLICICPLVSLICSASIYAYALEYTFNINIALDILLGIVFIGLGNYLPKCRQNNVVGIRIPSTLDDADNWNRTNRLAGWLFVLTGILWLFNIFLNRYILMLAITILAAFVPIFYSLGIHRKKQ